MKLACVMATRGRPKQAAAAIEIARALSSGRHDLDFVVCCDEDDTETQDRLSEYKQSIAPSPLYLGEVWNRGCAEIEADIYCPLPDDSFIACPDWDELIVRQLGVSRIKVMGWNDRANPGLMTLPIVGRDWYKATGLYPGIFPYWFYDTWVAEVYSFVTGTMPYLPPELVLTAKKGKTQRMRDLSFWWNVYSRTRVTRLKEAATLRVLFNNPLPDDAVNRMVQVWENRDSILKARLPQMQASMADTNQMPSEAYLQAKIAAEIAAEKLISHGTTN